MITKKQLKNMYFNNTNKQTCKLLKISNNTLMKYLEMFEIQKKGKGYGSRKSKGRTKVKLIF